MYIQKISVSLHPVEPTIYGKPITRSARDLSNPAPWTGRSPWGGYFFLECLHSR
nr:MAG TPA: hypothetical protein [Caudoviricetes sp.]